VDKQGIVRILGPGLAAAAVVLLVGLLVVYSDWKPDTGPAKPGVPSAAAKGKSASVASGDSNDSGMSDAMPSPDAPEWKDFSDGLKIWDVKVGDGDADTQCPVGATVNIHYTGWNLNGVSFDSSRGKPAANFPLGSLVKGWQLGIPGMKPGGIRRLLIPGPLAYGPRGGGDGKIAPNATLIFEIKFLGFS